MFNSLYYTLLFVYYTSKYSFKLTYLVYKLLL